MGTVQRSQELFERAQRSVAGGVSSGIRLTDKPAPLFFERGAGSRLYDADENEYVDYVLAHGPLILGHNPPGVIAAVKEQLERGIIYGAQHELEIEVSELLQRVVPGAGLVRYSNTGSEAVQHALRLARAYTGRDKIVKFEGHYHGWCDNILVSSHPKPGDMGPRDAPHAVPETKGQAKGAWSDVMVLPWNDLDLFHKAASEHRGELAAVIMEPIMGNSGNILPRAGYLEGMRQACTEEGIVLIFDEVITGFRYALGGAQEYLGVTPDLTTFAKAIAAGFPLSCLAGKQEIMDLIARGEVVHAGTYNSNPIVMAAAWATLRELEEDHQAIYGRLFGLGMQLADGLRAIFRERGVPSLVQGPGPAIHVSFTQRDAFYDYRDSLDRDLSLYDKYVAALAQRGVRTKDNGVWFLSAAHNQRDIDLTLDAARGAAKELFG